jgi:hypothetical protein
MYKGNEVVNFLRRQKRFFEKEFKVKKIGILGSCAREEIHEGSDIDIVVELEKPDLFCMIGIKQAVEEALGRKVDIVRLRENMNKALRARIERDVVYV